MTTYEVTAKRWRLGWELAYEGETVTQSHTLDDAPEQFRSWLESMTGEAPDGDVRITVDPGDTLP